MTKELLTKEMIQKDLRSKKMRRIRGHWMLFSVCVFGLGLMTAITVAANNVLFLILLIILLIPFLVFIGFMCHDYFLLHRINKGDFYITEDTLVDLKKELPIKPEDLLFRMIIGFRLRRNHFRRMKNIMTFAEHGDYFTEYGEGVVFRYSICGDTFYVVLFNGKRSMPIGVYNQRIYELKG